LPGVFSAELADALVPAAEPLAEGMAALFPVLRAAHPATQAEARIVTTADPRFPI